MAMLPYNIYKHVLQHIKAMICISGFPKETKKHGTLLLVKVHTCNETEYPKSSSP